jgi:hypothetical protein
MARQCRPTALTASGGDEEIESFLPNEINQTGIGLGAIRDMETEMITIMVSASVRCSSDSCSHSSLSAWVGPTLD